MKTDVIAVDPPMVEQGKFRRVLAEFASGITVIGTCEDGVATGFACQSFSALSLDPPLVLFCPSRGSRAWTVIERTGRFSVNVLSETQRFVSQAFGTRCGSKFTEIRWRESSCGSPLIDDCLAWIDCTLERVHDGGDHYIVVGRVHELRAQSLGARPLLFFRGGYSSTEPASSSPAPQSHLNFLTAYDANGAWF